MNNVSRKLGSTLIEYQDENPEIRTQYERECARNGVQVNIAMFRRIKRRYPDMHWRQRTRGEPFGVKATGLCLGTACRLSLSSELLRKTRVESQEPKTALKLFVSMPSLLRARPSFDTPS